MSNGLLVRVGIDLTAGGWNSPCNEKEFCYVPMGNSVDMSSSYDEAYAPYREVVDSFLPETASKLCRWPRLMPRQGHFDPDFRHLSFGDAGSRGSRILSMIGEGDFIVFYAGLRSVDTGFLIYSIIGFYVVDRIYPGRDVPQADWHRNAHTRHGGCRSDGEVVLFAKPGVSGRLLHHLPIGTYRERAWRVRPDLLTEWGDLDISNGYIQRSAYLPSFKKPELFLKWFHRQNPCLLDKNNP